MTIGQPDHKNSDFQPINGLEGISVNNAQRSPVETWNPQACREIDMRIAADGTWYYLGTPINRPEMTRLFASIMRLDDDGRHYLVTPVEKCAIAVDDAPFLAIAVSVSGDGRDRQFRFVTNVGDEFTINDDHPIRFQVTDAVAKPYLTVRSGLEALASRQVYYDLMQYCQEQQLDGETWFGLWSRGTFWPIAPSSELLEAD